jgi:hypothetical protein
MIEPVWAVLGGDIEMRTCGKKVGNDTFFTQLKDKLVVTYHANDGQIIQHSLKTIAELAEGDAPFESSDSDWYD